MTNGTDIERAARKLAFLANIAEYVGTHPNHWDPQASLRWIAQDLRHLSHVLSEHDSDE